jgi:integrase/recombinase XerD
MPRPVPRAASGAPSSPVPVLKSPLLTATMPMLAPPSMADPGGGALEPPPSPSVTPEQVRRMQVSEFAAWLRTQTNKHKRPFQEQTIAGYSEAALVLDRWMTAHSEDGDFTACDVSMLNEFFVDYRAGHSQGGTNNKQRNLHHMFKWLALRYAHPDPWASPEVVRYGPAKSRPSTLASEFIRDLLSATGDGRARTFTDVRDHAIIRMLTEGVRRTELAQIEIRDLSEDLVARPFVRVVPLKGAGEFSRSRLVPLMTVTATALSAYLRARRAHAQAALPALWLGSSNRGPLSGSGIYQMLERRAEQAGYDPRAVHPHMFRHTFANDQFSPTAAPRAT